jgi:hypothetical protein
LIGDDTKNQLNENICLSVQQTQATSHHADSINIERIKMSQSQNILTFNKNEAEAKAAQRVTADIQSRITDLAIRRENWEVNEYDRSNQSLYSLIAECLGLYLDLTTGNDLKAKKEGLAIHIKSHGYVFKEGSPLSLKVIRCVFGNKDRRRLSTYHTVLRVAIDEKWDVQAVAKNISERGGVQEVSLASSGGGITSAEKANVVRNALMGESVATLDSEILRRQFKTEHVAETAVAVLTVNNDGTYSVHCVVRSDSAVNAALVAYYAANKNDLQAVTQQQKMLKNDAAKAMQIADVAKAANDLHNRKVA